ncbi:DUF11 domain-containing protein [Microbacterium esteraromaticum]|uniref:DUF7927 domain-containing protein n=1 Tax=Microbacterium esteraromaticum TaxID=57043 RepID=UPI001C979E60|nr:DUF11 domain-containing protein [Microbacterium esteraromaticum]MBY6061004.1 DUF11 domain-containing protein [Microbacterium esteraromaticum]
MGVGTGPAQAAEEKLLFGCSTAGFATGNEGWRAASVHNYDGVTLKDEARESGWSSSDGVPPGSLRNPDLSGRSFTEIWTPSFAENGFSTDYSEVVGRSLSFDYKQETVRPVGERTSARYMGLVGANGTRYWTPYDDQLTADFFDWQHVSIAMDHARWTSEPPRDDGPGVEDNWSRTGVIDPSTSPSEADFVAALADLDRFVFAIEYTPAIYNEVALFDNFGVDCLLDLGKTSAAPADSKVGDDVNYTVTLENVGSGDYSHAHPARIEDDLSDVLDDATYNGDVAISLSDGSTAQAPEINDGTLTWAGPLPVGVTATITYSVKLTTAGDSAVVNSACVPLGLTPHGDRCVTTRTALPKIALTKSADIAELPDNGGTVTYQVTATNVGAGDATEDNLASFTDNLEDVLDDGTLVPGSLTASSGRTHQVGNSLHWSGPLAAAESVTVSYQIEYDANLGGDNVLVNVVCAPMALAVDPTDRCRQVQIPGAALQQWKTADPAPGAVAAGEEITYTLHFKNTGSAATTIANSDDLSAVLDDSVLIAGPTASSADLAADLDGETLRIDGVLPAGQEETISYTIRVLPFAERGDSVLTNALEQCEADEEVLCDAVTHRVRHLSVQKRSDRPVAAAGDTVTYTIDVTNTGTAAYTGETPATFTDNLVGVLDDARYDDNAHASQGTVVYDEDDGAMMWDGALAVGETATIKYSVTVRGDGDRVLNNRVCADVAGEEDVCSENTVPISELVVSKTVDPGTGTFVRPGDTLTYTIHLENTGTGDVIVNHEDDLSGVEDDAEITAAPISSTGTVSVSEVVDGRFSIEGTLAPGQSATVSYDVRVKLDGQRGDGRVVNFVVPSGIEPPASCDQDAGDYPPMCTINRVRPETPPAEPVPGGLAATGAEAAVAIGAVAVASLMLITGLLLTRRRRNTGDGEQSLLF